MIVGQENVGPIVGVTDTAGLSWQHRASSAYNDTATEAHTLDEWYAISALPLTGDNITATFAKFWEHRLFRSGSHGSTFRIPVRPFRGVPGADRCATGRGNRAQPRRAGPPPSARQTQTIS